MLAFHYLHLFGENSFGGGGLLGFLFLKTANYKITVVNHVLLSLGFISSDILISPENLVSKKYQSMYSAPMRVWSLSGCQQLGCCWSVCWCLLLLDTGLYCPLSSLLSMADGSFWGSQQNLALQGPMCQQANISWISWSENYRKKQKKEKEGKFFSKNRIISLRLKT